MAPVALPPSSLPCFPFIYLFVPIGLYFLLSLLSLLSLATIPVCGVCLDLFLKYIIVCVLAFIFELHGIVL